MARAKKSWDGLSQDPDLLVEPAFFTHPEYHATLGPEIVELAATTGMVANPEQQLVLDAKFGITKAGKFAAFETCIVCCRQNLKTGALKIEALGKLFLLKRKLLVWTAHKASATTEAHREMVGLIEQNPDFARRIKQIRWSEGREEIELLGGQRLLFRPRTGKTGQSMTGDDLLLDELFAADSAQMASLVPIMSTRRNAQIVYASSAPHAASAYLRSVMARGRAGDPKMVYGEWSVERLLGHDAEGRPIYGPPSCSEPDCDHALHRVGCICDNIDLVKAANPSVARSAPPAITVEYIRDERRMLAAAIQEYMRERLGVGEKPSSQGGAIAPDLWEARKSQRAQPEATALGVAIDLDRTWASVGIVGGTYLGAVRHDRLGPWVLETTRRHALELDIPVGIDTRGPAASLIGPLRDDGVTVVDFSTDDYIQACTDVYDGLVAGTVDHGDHDDLNAAVEVAGWRSIGDRRVWARAGGDITMLEADTLAFRAPLLAEQPYEPFFARG